MGWPQQEISPLPALVTIISVPHLVQKYRFPTWLAKVPPPPRVSEDTPPAIWEAAHSLASGFQAVKLGYVMCWWAREDSNLRPIGYEPTALPLSYGPACLEGTSSYQTGAPAGQHFTLGP